MTIQSNWYILISHHIFYTSSKEHIILLTPKNLIRIPTGWASPSFSKTEHSLYFRDPDLYNYIPLSLEYNPLNKVVSNVKTIPAPPLENPDFFFTTFIPKNKRVLKPTDSHPAELNDTFLFIGELTPQLISCFRFRKGQSPDFDSYSYLYRRNREPFYYLTTHSHFQMTPGQFLDLIDYTYEPLTPNHYWETASLEQEQEQDFSMQQWYFLNS